MDKHKHTVFVLILFVLTACSLPTVGEQTPLAPTISSPVEVTPTFILPETAEPEPSPTMIATEIIQPTPPVKVIDSAQSTPVIVATPVEMYRFVVQAGTPVLTSNFVDLEAGCNWMGVAGQVFNRTDQPVEGLIAEVGGSLAGNTTLSLALTGGFSALGSGGYLIKLSDQPIASENTLWVQLFDLSGTALSEKVYFSTFAGDDGCEKNLVVVNFRELGSLNPDYYFPSILKGQK
jgi:hypothetical protein